MPLLLYTYLATEILAPFFASLLILNGVLFLGRLVPLLDVIFTLGIDFADFVRLSAYIAPKLLLFSIPMASMMGVIVAFTKLINDNEMMALKASGIGLYRMVPPVMLVALCTAVLTVFSATQMIPKGTVAMKKLFFQLAKEKIDKGIQPDKFSEGLKNVVVYVDHIDPETNLWRGVYVSDLRHKDTPVTVMAQAGNLHARMRDMQIILTLNNGSMHRGTNDITQTIRFKRYTLNLPFEPPTTIDGDSLTQVGKNGMSQAELLKAAENYGTDTPEGLSMLIEYHQRLALPAGCFILTILGLPLAMQSKPGRRSVGVPLGLLFFIAYYIMLTAGKTVSEGGKIPVEQAMWLPNVVFAALTVYFTRRAAREYSSSFIEKMFEPVLIVLDRLPRPGKGAKK